MSVDHARAYLAAGWSPIPLPAGKKWPPPEGVTGWRGRYLVATDGHDWTGNIALRLPPDVVGVDVDVYAGGDVALKELEERFGELPPTTWSTSRGDGSGIALFRVPNGTTLLTDPAEGIDMIQCFHRYVVCAPSIHPEGRAYRWIDELAEEEVDLPPHPGDLPDLPWAWIEGLATQKTGAAEAATPHGAREFLDAHTETGRAGALGAVIRSLTGVTKGGRHDALVRAACWLARESAAGWYPAADAFDQLYAWWTRVVADDARRRDGGEFGSAILWAIGQALADPDRVQKIRDELDQQHDGDDHARDRHDDDPGPEWHGDGDACGPVGTRNLPEEFWTARPELERIRQAAHARARSADAVLGAALARVATLTPPTLTIDTGAGTPACLNVLLGLVGLSGAGKTSSAAVARDLVPIIRTDIVADVPLGSGEGVVELFFETVTEDDANGKKTRLRRQTKTAALLTLDEGQALTEMGARKGATLLPTLRSAWSGETIGQMNAREETRRVVKGGSYRLAVIVGFQAAAAGAVLADHETGTPQRFVLFAANDPEIPDVAPEWPEDSVFTTPATISGQTITVDPDVKTEVRTRLLKVQRGELVLATLDSHRDLSRLKIAALLAILAGRANVDADDWRLAGMVLDTSDRVRTWVLDTNTATENNLEDARTRAAVKRQRIAARALEDDVHARAVDRGARAMGRLAHRQAGETITTRDLSRAVAGRDREHATIDEMTAQAVSMEWIRPDGDGWVAGKSRPS